ncbi:MAG TPA: carbohydrate binding family 9 domain-containing protein, partial [Vicinamibacterales bacterium]|nr:carbohydrate binding family 9 domain-containing protein [Vicinamibacterales bacterium]
MLLVRPVAGAMFLAALAAGTASAQNTQNGGIDYDTARNERRLKAAQAQGAITLDGRLDEASWAAAPLATNFIQNDPREGEPATYDTEVKLLYDDRALYIGVFARDPEPGQIIVNELRKDFNTGSADGFQVVIDTFNDERNGYQFAISPAGAKWDSQMSNEGREQNANWDGIWDVSTRIGDDGWYAEIEIPFKTLKFGPAEMQTWG